MVDRKNTDASRLSFPLQLVVVIVSAVVAGLGANYASQSSVRQDQSAIRSDVRDIITRLELGRDVSKAQREAQDQQLAALKSSIEQGQAAAKLSIDAVSRRQEMQQIQISELKDAITKLSQGRK